MLAMMRKHKKSDRGVSADRKSEDAKIDPAGLLEESAVAEVDGAARERIGKLIAEGATKRLRKKRRRSD